MKQFEAWRKNLDPEAKMFLKGKIFLPLNSLIKVLISFDLK